MKNKPSIIMWSLAILVYISNIVVAIVLGSNIATSIGGWATAIGLAVCIMILEGSISRKDEIIRKVMDYSDQMFQSCVKFVQDIELPENKDPQREQADNTTQENE